MTPVLDPIPKRSGTSPSTPMAAATTASILRFGAPS